MCSPPPLRITPHRLATQPSKLADTRPGFAHSGKYNEVLISSQDYRDQLPEAVVAVFFTGDDAANCADNTRRAITGSFGIDPGQVLLLNHTPGGSPGFAVYTPPERPEDAFCSKPAGWCEHYSAQNEAKECGGQPGHFCHDSFGKSGFSPCDEKVEATWGTVQCEEIDSSTDSSADEDGKRSERRGASVYWWAAGATTPGSRGGGAAAKPVPSSGPRSAPGLSLAQQRHQHRWSHLLELLVGAPSSSQLVWNSSLPRSGSPHNGSAAVPSFWKNITSLFGSGGSSISRDKRAAAMMTMYDGIAM